MDAGNVLEAPILHASHRIRWYKLKQLVALVSNTKPLVASQKVEVVGYNQYFLPLTKDILVYVEFNLH